MSRDELTTVQNLVLACIAWRGPQTPYQLKDYVTRTVSWLWPFPHAQLYTEPAKLAARGLLTEEVEQGGRRRRTYSITDEGIAAVHAWLREPTMRPPEVRDLGLLKHHFGALVEAEDMVQLAQTRLEVERERRRLLAEALGSSDHDAERRRFVRSGARYGLGMADSTIRFWENVVADPDRRYEQQARADDYGPWDGT